MLVASQIASSLDLDERQVYIASLIGLFHDYGRFEQLRALGKVKEYKEPVKSFIKDDKEEDNK